ncbi:MAG: hypothetical protein OXM01_00380 [Gemmatimonadota bacterium]|nr:hypothetical protein [Gemmatimonadota bacterium]
MTNSELQKSREILESLTVESLQTSEGQGEFNQMAGKYIRGKIKKTSLFYKVMPPQFIAEDQLKNYAMGEQPDLRCLMSRVLVPSNPKPVKAMLMDMDGEPVPEYVDGKKQLLIPMRTVKTKWFEKTTEELSGSGILKVVEEMASWEVKERDRKFLKYCELAVAQSGQMLRENGPLQRDHFRKIKQRSLMKEINPEVVLLSEIAFMDLDLPDSATEICDMTCIPSTKKELFDTWNNGKLASTIWSFPAPEFLGYNLYCGNYKVQSQGEANRWSCQGWEMVGAGIGNINGITKLAIASSHRLGFMAGEIKVPEDFDSMGGPEIEKMFGGG